MKHKTINLIGLKHEENLLKRLQQSKEHYIVSRTNYTTKIHLPEHKLSYLIAPDYTHVSTWGQLASIKAKILRDHDTKPLPSVMSREINYFKFSKEIDSASKRQGFTKNFDNVSEIDITAAYVSMAHVSGIIEKKHHDKLIKGPKANRLKVLGALASQKIIEYWHGNEKIDERPEVNLITRNAWFNIVKKTDTVINSIYDDIGKAGLFYYVDNIYFYTSPELIELIFYRFKQADLTCKLYELENFFLFNAQRGAVVCIKRKRENKIRTFFVPQKKIIKYSIIE